MNKADYFWQFCAKSGRDVAEQLISNLKNSSIPILVILEIDKVNLKPFPYYHAVLVYKFDGNKFFVYDSNFPGSEMTISYDGQNLEDYFITSNPLNAYVDHAVMTSQLYHPYLMQNVFNSFPLYVSGTWNYSNTGIVSCTYAGQTETENVSGSGSINLNQNQNDSKVSWTEPVYDKTRSGTVNASKIQVFGLFAVPLEGGVQITQNSYTSEGTICGDNITLNGTGIAAGTYEGMSFTCTGTDKLVLTRSGPTPMVETLKERQVSPEASRLFLNKVMKVLTNVSP